MTATVKGRLVRSRVPPPQPAAMTGPKWAAAAIVLFFAGSILAVHLAYDGDAPVLAADGAAVPVADPATADVGPQPVPRSSAVPRGNAVAAPPVDTSVPFAIPAASASSPGTRELDACMERVIGAAAEPRPTAPGRWPAIKRAREALRAKRLAARATCERELAL